MTHRVYRHQVTPTITAVTVTMDGVFGRPDAPIVGRSWVKSGLEPTKAPTRPANLPADQRLREWR
jgi:hypothetical protein